MKKNIIAITITLLVATAGALTLVQCDHSNMARVTIHMKPYNLSNNSTSSTVLDFLCRLFSKPLYAGDFWNADHEYITLYIEGSDMAPIEVVLPDYTENYTTEVPAGPQRMFTIIAKSTTLSAPPNNWGGRTIALLSPGNNDISIIMGSSGIMVEK